MVVAAAIVVLALAAAVTALNAAVDDPVSTRADRALGVEDGYDSSGRGWSATASVPAVSRLDPALRQALQRAAHAAADDGRDVRVVSGWRSPEHQRRLFADAVRRYGSPAAAERWVARPGSSRHERGEAVDVGGYAETIWMQHHGPPFGLCQVYENEPWHYELLAVDGHCPALRTDGSASR